MQLADSVVVVGGAASGLGAATAQALMALGTRVVLADLNLDAGRALAAGLGPGARFIATDVCVEDSVAACLDEAETLGTLRGLVNCAGIAPAARVLGKSGVHALDTFANTIAVNLVGTFNLLRLVAERIARTDPDARGERGVLINTASIAAFDGQIGQAAYAASKGGIVAMTLPIARELAQHGIRVMTIAPGIMATPMLLGMPAEVQQALAESVPFPHRLGEPSEFADLVLHIFANRYLNGEVIRLDGALRMAAR